MNQCARIEKDVAEFKKTHTWPKDWVPIVDKNNPQDQALSEKMSISWGGVCKNRKSQCCGSGKLANLQHECRCHENFSYGQETITGLFKDRIAYQALHFKGNLCA
ncbi:hypothetical protein [Polynucleobacter necessarius]|uniref:hypothetical protein n=1 Tax=Polynucleobacter necessarius TaxID=576610 RepID=UPI000E09DCA7|nr:hypothetical protein [Polynucleobacter necessarius]